MVRYQVGLQTEAKIIEATKSLLAEGGLEVATLKSICDRANIKAGSFYNLFDSKEEAVIRVVQEAILAVDPDPEGAGTDTVDDLVAAYVRFFTEEPQLARVYVMAALTGESSTSGAKRRFLRHHVRRVERFADAMSRADTGLKPDDANDDAELLLGALDGLAFRWSLEPDFDFARFADLAATRFH